MVPNPMAKPPWKAWNQTIGESIFSPVHADRRVFLAIDEDEIRAIGKEKLALNPATAFELFRETMRDAIDVGGWSSAEFDRARQIPRYLSYLVLQVVAAFRMRNDEVVSAKAYWRRLRELLDQPPGDVPP